MDNEAGEREFTKSDTPSGSAVRILPDDRPVGPSAYIPQSTPERSLMIGRDEQLVEGKGAKPGSPEVRHRTSTCSIVVITGGLLILSCMLLTFATVRDGAGGLGKLTGLIPSINFALATPTVIIDTSRPSVVEQVRALSKLETVHYQIEKVISGNSTGPLPEPFTGDKILLVAHGEVVAGVDLNKLAASSVISTESAVTITLPAPEIMYSKLDNTKTHVYDRQTGFFSKPDPNLESQLRATAEAQIVQAAKEDGILEIATTNAETTLRTLLTALGYSSVQFKEAP